MPEHVAQGGQLNGPPPVALSGGHLHWWERADPWADRSVFTSLDTPELKAHALATGVSHLHPAIPRDATAWRHYRWQSVRQNILAAMTSHGIPFRRIERYRECGSKAWIYVDAADRTRFALMGSACRDRFCPTCQAARAAVIRYNLTQAAAHRRARFVTLTLRHTYQPLADQLDHLYASFASLRRLHFWKEHVTGGAAFCEVKLNRQHHTWHVHLHCIVHGTYLDQRHLSACWEAVTQGSKIVDVRAVKNERDLGAYVTKYLTKPLSSTILEHPGMCGQAILAFHRRHLCMTFGAWRGWKLTEVERTTTWEPVCSFNTLMNLCQAGAPEAVAVMSQLWRTAHPKRIHTLPPHQPINSTVDDYPDNHSPPATPADLATITLAATT